MSKNLYSLISTQKAKGKIPLGYSVSSYTGVLEALKKNEGTSRVLGVGRSDFSGIQSMTFDSQTGITNNPETGIWKMAVGVSGAIPVQYQNAFDIVKFGNESTQNANRNPFCSSYQFCPLQLSDDAYQRITKDDFRVGVALDLSGFGLRYFQFCYGTADASITEQMVAALFEKGCLHAQLIFPKNNKSLVASVIGQTPFTNNACCYFNSALLCAQDWKDAGIVLNIKDSSGVQQLSPNGQKYKVPFSGGFYSAEQQSVRGFSKTQFKKWLDNSAEKFVNVPESLELVKPTQTQCYVKIFIPKSKETQARQILPSEIKGRIFEQYRDKVIDGGSETYGAFSGKIEARMNGVSAKWKNVLVHSNKGLVYGLAGYRPNKLVRGKGNSFGHVTALFGHEKSTSYFDCSSLPFLLWYDADILQDRINEANTFGTSTMSTAPDYLNKIIKPEFKVIKMEITSDTKYHTGDIVWVQSSDGTGDHHAAFIQVEGDAIYSFEINSSSSPERAMRRTARRNSPMAGFYKHLLRIVDNNG